MLQLMSFCLGNSVEEKGYMNVLATFSMRFWLGSGTLYKNNDHTCLFHCIFICQIPPEMLKIGSTVLSPSTRHVSCLFEQI